MSQFTVNPHRQDPYKGFKFRVVWDGRTVAGVSRISGLRRSTEVIEYREGSEPNAVRKLPGRTKFDAITLERGVTHDLDFLTWANQVHAASGGVGASLKHFRKDVAVELDNEQGQLAMRWTIYRCWVSAYEALAALDANASSVAIERLTLENEGWARDLDVPEPTET